MSGHGIFAVRSLLATISWIPVYLTFTEHVCYVVKVEGASMRPTLNPDESLGNDWVLVWRFGSKGGKNWKENDVVIFKSPYDAKKLYCKRVKGLQYTSVRTRDPYPKDICLIPRNHLWVEGDNVTRSIDSNNFGPISTGLAIGKATRIIWPPERWGSDLKKSVGRGDLKVFLKNP